jgi:iron complex outermembrane receptor protein
MSHKNQRHLQQCFETVALKVAAASIAASLVPVTLTHAQGAAESPSASQSVLLETVLVSARKRAADEAVEDTPLAISAFGAAQLEAVFADNLDDIGKLAPSVGLKPTSQVGGQNFTIRGMGVSGTTASDEPAVGIIQDGVYWGSNYGAMLDTFDVESVEILRGPQGTLFGRNVTGGAVLVRTARPTGEFDAAVQTVVGNYGRLDLSGKIEAPVIQDKLAVKLAVLDRNLDGYNKNLANGRDFGENNSTLIRGTLLATPTETFEASLILESYQQDGDSTAAVGVEVAGNGPYNSGFRQPRDFWDVQLDNPGYSDIEVNFGVLEMNWEVLAGKVTSITGLRDVEVANTTDYDGSQFSYFNQSIAFEQDQFSQELIYSSEYDGRVNFTAGLYYFKQDYTHTEGRDLNRHATLTITRAHLDQEAYAAFGEADIKLADRWTLTLGARYTEETKEAKSVPFTPAATLCADRSIYGFEDCAFPYGASDDHTWSDFSPKVVVGFTPNDDHLLYASATRGFRSGGYSLRGNPIFEPFDSEEVNAFELGYKGELFDGTVRLNAAGYVNKYKDLQRTILGVDPVFGVVQSTFNVADATIQGIELDVVAQATDHLVLTAGYGYTDASYDSATAGFNTNLDFVRVPEQTFAGSATYTFDLDIGQLSLRGGVSYTDKEFFNDANTVSGPAYTLVDASIDYVSSGKQWKVSLFGKNLTEEEYSYWGSTLGALGANRFIGAPLTYGLRVGYDF